ncbi:putative LRR receptor-like serine/threonine-protein kinase, partial [Cucurbita argyrosperma subsp. sororia]
MHTKYSSSIKMADSPPPPQMIHFFCVFILAFAVSLGSSISTLESDKQALISLKSGFNHHHLDHPLSSWNQNSSPCNWTGVSCDKDGKRVIGLDLSGLALAGSVHIQIGNLLFLKSLQLQNNQITGQIPVQISNLSRLKVLNMSFNYIRGALPSNMSGMAELEILDLTSNRITSQIPEELSRLTKLKVLNLGQNHLYGTIPPSFGNLSSLITLNLGTNSVGGSIPSELGRLQNLKNLVISINNFSGFVPPSIYNMSSLVTLILAANRLHGTLPKDFGDNLPNLLFFNFCFNRFSGTIPESMHNMTQIRIIRFAHNLFEGTIPPGLENLPDLQMYYIGHNKIVSSGRDGLSFISSLTNSSRLTFIAADENYLEGVIPESIGNLSKVFSRLYMGGNRIYGNIPSSIGNLQSLTLLNLNKNKLSGEIPPQIGQLEQLQLLGLAQNQLFGRIPSSLGSLGKLNHIDLSGNNLVGDIPNSFGNFTNLLAMDLSNNKLSGGIPKEALNFPSLSMILNLSNNMLSGNLPEEIKLLENVEKIDISENLISGEIPSSISDCKSLEVLIMAKNEFSGQIPSSLGNILGLRALDLSSNKLTGPIPRNLQNRTALQLLNLSFNDLEGVAFEGGDLKRIPSVYLEGNPKLCLPSVCVNNKPHNEKRIKIIALTVVFSTLALCFTMGAWFYLTKRKPRTPPLSTDELKRQHEMVSYAEIRAATANFSQENLVGKGSFGSVYKGYLNQEHGVVAIKVLNIERTGYIRSFFAECEASRSVRHRKLVKLITSCSSIDFEGRDFRALVYEFLSNGSLAEWIHGERRHLDGSGLGFLERLNIGIDVCSVLEYLHHGSEVPIVHCDLKPCNVLLAEDMTAKVGDFGLARLLIENEGSPYSSIADSHVLRGSIGYIPPEYGMGRKATVAGDVYSFGITLLELFTGRSPTHEDFRGEHNLTKWVQSSYLRDLMQTVGSPNRQLNIGFHSHNEGRQISEDKMMKCLIEVIDVGISCTADYANTRITMKDALSRLENARHSLLKTM